MGLTIHQLGLLILGIIALVIAVLIITDIGDVIVDVFEKSIAVILFGT